LRIPSNVYSNYYKYITLLDREINRDELKQKLRSRGVICGGEVYWPPLHLQPLYRKVLGTKEGDFPVAEDVCRRMLCLPLHASMSTEDARYVVEKLREVLGE